MSPRVARITKLVRQYQALMGLTAWHISIKFTKVDDGDEAACNADDEYQCATLYFDLKRLPVMNEATVVRHELLHCLTWKLLRVAEHLADERRDATEMVRAASERCVTMLERMPVWDR